MRSILITFVVIFTTALPSEARSSRLYNIYFLEESRYLNPAWYGDSVFGADEKVPSSLNVEEAKKTDNVSTSRRRRFNENKVETMSLQKEPQAQENVDVGALLNNDVFASCCELVTHTVCLIHKHYLFAATTRNKKSRRHGWLLGIGNACSMEDVLEHSI